MKAKAIIGVAILVAIVGSGALLIRNVTNSGDGSDMPSSVLYTVQRGKLTVTITENGTLMAKNSEKITFRGRRGGKIAYLIEEGETVDEQAVLCKLETSELEKEVHSLELSIVKTEADLNSAKTELEIEKSDNVAKIEKARITLSKTEKQRERYRDGDAPKERRKLAVAIKQAETNHSRAKKRYEDSVKLLEQKFINKSQVEQDEIDFEQAQMELDGARQDLVLFEKYTLPMTLTDRQAAHKDADRELKNAEKRAEATLRQKEVAVESQAERLKQLRDSLTKAVEEVASCTIKSPSQGIVIYGDPNQPWRRDEIKLGGQVWGGFTLFTIPDLREMQVQVQIHEADIIKVKLGQKVTVTMDTYPGLVFAGQVTKVAAIAGGRDRWGRGNDEVKKFTVDVTLDSTKGHTLKPGISAKSEIFIERRESVLFVPLQCVYLEEGMHYSLVWRGGEPVRVAVKADLSNDTYVQITEGLEEGEQVLLYNPILQAAAQTAAAVETTPAPAISAAGPVAGKPAQP